jgi:hypothetical protein
MQSYASVVKNCNGLTRKEEQEHKKRKGRTGELLRVRMYSSDETEWTEDCIVTL